MRRRRPVSDRETSRHLIAEINAAEDRPARIHRTLQNVGLAAAGILTALVLAAMQPIDTRAAGPGEGWEAAGQFKLTWYCPCKRCSGKWGHQTSSGATCQEGVTAACAVLPAGTEVYIEGIGTRVVQDTGAGVKGKHLDIFLESHSECIDEAHGVKYKNVWIRRQ